MKYFLTIVALAFAMNASAQGLFSVTYDISVPMGEMKDYIGTTSARGVSIDGRGYVNDVASVGGNFSWHTFYEAIPSRSETFGDTRTITGQQWRYVNSFPLMINAHYYFADEFSLRPYIGGGLGTTHVIKSTNFGVYTIEDKNWHFGIQPEIGVLVPMGLSDTKLMAKIKYNYAFKTKETINYSYLSFNVGFAF